MELRDHDEESEILYIDEIAHKLRFKSKRNVYRMVKDNKLPGAFKVGNRWAIRAEVLDAWLAEKEGQHKTPVRAISEHQRHSQSPSSHEATTFSQTRAALERAAVSLAPAITNGITAIYPPRSSNHPDGHSAHHVMGDLLEKATGLILLQGTTLQSFFRNTPLRYTLERRLKDRALRVKALLLDPCSDAARARVTIEEAEQGGQEYLDNPKKFAESQTFVDIQRTVATIQTFRKHELQIDARFYDCMPFAFLLLTNRGMIIEQYHLGRDVTSMGGIGNLGEHVPLLHIEPNSPFYQQMRNSFLTLWFVGGDDDDDELTPRTIPQGWENIFLSVKEIDKVYTEMRAVREEGRWPERKIIQSNSAIR